MERKNTRTRARGEIRGGVSKQKKNFPCSLFRMKVRTSIACREGLLPSKAGVVSPFCYRSTNWMSSRLTHEPLRLELACCTKKQGEEFYLKRSKRKQLFLSFLPNSRNSIPQLSPPACPYSHISITTTTSCQALLIPPSSTTHQPKVKKKWTLKGTKQTSRPFAFKLHTGTKGPTSQAGTRSTLSSDGIPPRGDGLCCGMIL